MRAIQLLLIFFFCVPTAWANEYLSGDKFNFRFNPVGVLVGDIGLNLDIAITHDWTIGPQLEYGRYNVSSDSSWYSDNYHYQAWAIGVRANWFRHGIYKDGLYVGPSLNYVRLWLNTKDLLGNSVTGTAGALMLQGLVGYAWFWNSGFNIMLGGGAAVGLGDVDVTVSYLGTQRTVTTNVSGLAAEFSLGWTF